MAFVDEVVVAVAEEHQVDEARRRSGTQPNFVWFATSQVDNHYENQRQGGWLRIDEVGEVGPLSRMGSVPRWIADASRVVVEPQPAALRATRR